MSTAPQRVIACVIRRGDRLLVCQRPAHKRHGGLWEFPGGKAEPNESDAHAAARELGEELGVDLVRAEPANFEIADPGSPYIIVFVSVEMDGEPVPTEHNAIMWARASQLLSLPLAPSDRAFVEWLLTDQRTPADG